MINHRKMGPAHHKTITTPNKPLVPMLRVVTHTFFMLLCLVTLSTQAKETRIALVIGNANYSTMGRLPNPSNDATDIAQVLRELNFQVISGINLSKKAMAAKIREFDNKLRNSDKDNTIGLFYYAGHGLEVDGKNYLVPVDADMEFQEDAREEGIPLNRVITRMSYSKNRMNIVVLDACRNNPLPKRDRDLSSGGWSALDNLADGMFIAYGTAPGRKAADGKGRNGLFTKYILKNIKTTGKTLEQVFKATRLGVREESRGKQITWQNNATTGDFYFVPNNALASVQPNTQTNQIPTNFSIYNRPRPAPGKTYKDCPECPEMTVIPAGEFMMGSTDGEDDEKPVHKVTIKEFSLGTTEITINQFKDFIDATGYQTDAEKNSGGAEGCYIWNSNEDKGYKKGTSWQNNDSNQTLLEPVTCVSWFDAQEYIKWLNKKTGKIYRLPSEAEWEYAARAGTTGQYSWSKFSNQCNYANGADKKFDDAFPETTYNVANCNDGYFKTAPVGSYKSNPFGLFDMHGNVWEWVEDKWHDNYSGAPSNGSSWTSGSSAYRVLRGGSWDADASSLRSANRGSNTPSLRGSIIGFRLAQDK